MQLHYTVWVKDRDGQISPVIAPSPSGITTSEVAREDARKWVIKRMVRAHSLDIEDEDGIVIEQWVWRRNKWKPGPAPAEGLTAVQFQHR